ncbi:hypothetical protein GCM10025794_24770 [Massilia kyonggiensis]
MDLDSYYEGLNWFTVKTERSAEATSQSEHCCLSEAQRRTTGAYCAPSPASYLQASMDK